jgi:hypothetical protein
VVAGETTAIQIVARTPRHSDTRAINVFSIFDGEKQRVHFGMERSSLFIPPKLERVST